MSTTTHAQDDRELSALEHRYFQHIPQEQLSETDTEALISAHRQLAEQRPVGRAVVRLHRPQEQWPGATPILQVVTDDMPYLVESLSSLLTDSGLGLRMVVHPVVVVRRDMSGALQEVLPDASTHEPPEGTVVESWMTFEIEPGVQESSLDELEDEALALLGDVRQVVEDTAKMQAVQRDLAGELDQAVGSKRFSELELTEAAELLRWLANGNFTVLGYRRYEVTTKNGKSGKLGERVQRAVLGSGLGVLRNDELKERTLDDGSLDDEVSGSELLVLTQSSTPTRVLRPVFPYFVGVLSFDESGTVTGEHRFLGVFTIAALNDNVLDIPVLARRTREVIERAGYDLNSYSGQAILEVAQTYPRTELFSTDTDTLFDIGTTVVALGQQRAVRLFLREDTYGRFISCMVYLPRDRYTTRARTLIQEALIDEFDGSSLDYTARVSESPLALVHLTVQTPEPVELNEELRARLQEKVAAACRTWDDRLLDELESGSKQGVDARVLRHYAEALPQSYKESFAPAHAIGDILRMQSLAGGEIDVALYRPEVDGEQQLRFVLYLAGDSVSLSRVLPVLQSMNVEVLDERPYLVHRPDDLRCWMYDFGLRVDRALLDDQPEGIEPIRDRFVDTFTAAWHGTAEVDGFNALVLAAGLDWRQAMLLRAYAKYIRQAGLPYNQSYLENVLLDNPQVCTTLLRLFGARLDPEQVREHQEVDRNAGERKEVDPEEGEYEEDKGGEHEEGTSGDSATEDEAEWDEDSEAVRTHVDEVTKLIDEVTSLDADRILRAFLSLIQATLRTNYYVDGDGPRSYLSFKLHPTAIPELPKPRPEFEIFVYSPRVEGVHLRFGAVARGGLRWSDRKEDFRTEILGLVKAQAVKNAVIVPVGAKGGFVVKQPPTPTDDAAADREALQKEGISCYRTFISGLLDLTDNLDPVADKTLPPRQVVRHDSDDSYLVVAADKGTASFSDIANEVSADYNYWLGDAFASGGSAGYDHKVMGITAKGAWESVKRHFREMGVDTQQQEFTVVGVGDMSGDVFGNGMLLSEHIRLVAAFDHRHVFVDPNPVADTSFAERKRLFSEERSSWEDYDTELISEGGGVWPRTLKSIAITEQMRDALGLESDVDKLSPAELVHAILLAPVDLLWNGGIGTYVKASGEANAEVGDKANDGLRVNGSELRVKVVGEGGNLGITQRGRIEFARAGGRVNTDALDNSAGVDCSDHEVNIKILLDALVTDDTLPAEERNPLLESMTDEVTRLVLADNDDQNELMGLSRSNAAPMVGVHSRLVSHLERTAGLDRALEALPTKAGFRSREQAGEGLTSPELATLMAQVKLALKSDVLASDLPDANAFRERLPHYFPEPLPERFPDAIGAHPLRREIVTTMVVNDVVSTGGITYAFRLGEETGATSTDAVRAHAAATGIFDLTSLWSDVRSLGAELPTEVTDELAHHIRRLLDRASRWLLSNRPQPLAVGPDISRFREPITTMSGRVSTLLRGAQADAAREQTEQYVQQDIPEKIAARVAVLLHAYGLLDVVDVADIAEREPEEVAELYYALSDHLDIDRMLTAVSELERGDRWHSLARLSLRDDLYSSLRLLTLDLLGGSEPDESPDEKIEQWEQTNSSRLERARTSLMEIAVAGALDLATLSVAVRQVRSMVRAAGGASRPSR